MFFVLSGCAGISGNAQNNHDDILYGTIGVSLKDPYDRKTVRQRLHPDGGDMIIVDGKTGQLYVTSFLRTNKEVRKDLFDKIRATGFYDNKQYKAIFTFRAKAKITGPINWGIENSGWGTVDTPFKAEKGVVFEKIIDLKLVRITKPRDCYEKGYPCSAPEYRAFENYCRPYLEDLNKKLPSYILEAPPCYDYKKLDQRNKWGQFIP